MVHVEHYNPFTAMTAIEIGHPKLDLGAVSQQADHSKPVRVPELLAAYPRPADLTLTTTLRIMDATLCRLATHLSGHMQAQTVCTSLYLLRADDAEFLDGNIWLSSFLTSVSRCVTAALSIAERSRVCFDDESMILHTQPAQVPVVSSQRAEECYRRAIATSNTNTNTNTTGNRTSTSTNRDTSNPTTRSTTGTTEANETTADNHITDEVETQHDTHTAVLARVHFVRYMSLALDVLTRCSPQALREAVPHLERARAHLDQTSSLPSHSASTTGTTTTGATTTGATTGATTTTTSSPTPTPTTSDSETAGSNDLDQQEGLHRVDSDLPGVILELVPRYLLPMPRQVTIFDWDASERFWTTFWGHLRHVSSFVDIQKGEWSRLRDGMYAFTETNASLIPRTILHLYLCGTSTGNERPHETWPHEHATRPISNPHPHSHSTPTSTSTFPITDHDASSTDATTEGEGAGLFDLSVAGSSLQPQLPSSASVRSPPPPAAAPPPPPPLPPLPDASPAVATARPVSDSTATATATPAPLLDSDFFVHLFGIPRTCSQQYADFLDATVTTVSTWTQIVLLHSCRRQRKLRAYLSNWADLYDKAEAADSCGKVQEACRAVGYDPDDRRGSAGQGIFCSWVERESALVMGTMLLAAIALDLIRPPQYCMIYWYLDYVLGIALAGTKEVDGSKGLVQIRRGFANHAGGGGGGDPKGKKKGGHSHPRGSTSGSSSHLSHLSSSLTLDPPSGYAPHIIYEMARLEIYKALAQGTLRLTAGLAVHLPTTGATGLTPTRRTSTNATNIANERLEGASSGRSGAPGGPGGGLAGVPDGPSPPGHPPFVFNTEEEWFGQRFSAFHSLLRPEPLHYEQYKQSIDVTGVSLPRMLALSLEAFNTAHQLCLASGNILAGQGGHHHHRHLPSLSRTTTTGPGSPPSASSSSEKNMFGDLAVVAKTNVLAVTLLARMGEERSRDMKIEWDFRNHPYFPTIRIKKG